MLKNLRYMIGFMIVVVVICGLGIGHQLYLQRVARSPQLLLSAPHAKAWKRFLGRWQPEPNQRLPILHLLRPKRLSEPTGVDATFYVQGALREKYSDEQEVLRHFSHCQIDMHKTELRFAVGEHLYILVPGPPDSNTATLYRQPLPVSDHPKDRNVILLPTSDPNKRILVARMIRSPKGDLNERGY